MLNTKIEAVTAILRKQEVQAYQLIMEAGQDGILLYELSSVMFGPRIGFERSKIHGVRVCVCTLRKKLEPFGISIPFAKISGRYRIEVTA